MPINPRVTQQLRSKLLDGLEGIAVELTNQAKIRATKHVFTGERRQSITHTRREHDVLWGMVATAKNVALEYGFKPHWVPNTHVAAWMRATGFGILRVRSTRVLRSGHRSTRVRQFLTAGVYVGGKNSKLEQGPGQPGGRRGRAPFKRWDTRGGRSPDLAPNTVGHSVIRWTIRTRLRAIGSAAFLQGYNRG